MELDDNIYKLRDYKLKINRSYRVCDVTIPPISTLTNKISSKINETIASQNWKRKESTPKTSGRSGLSLSEKTRDFIQRICYRKAASIDMTRHGFIEDSKQIRSRYKLRPFRTHVEKICAPMAIRGNSRSQFPKHVTSTRVNTKLNNKKIIKQMCTPKKKKYKYIITTPN